MNNMVSVAPKHSQERSFSFRFFKMSGLSWKWWWVKDFQIKIAIWMKRRMNSDFISKFCLYNTETFCYKCVHSIISWCSPCCVVLLWDASPSKLVLSLLNKFADLAWKSAKGSKRKGYFCARYFKSFRKFKENL